MAVCNSDTYRAIYYKYSIFDDRSSMSMDVPRGEAGCRCPNICIWRSVLMSFPFPGLFMKNGRFSKKYETKIIQTLEFDPVCNLRMT